MVQRRRQLALVPEQVWAEVPGSEGERHRPAGDPAAGVGIVGREQPGERDGLPVLCRRGAGVGESASSRVTTKLAEPLAVMSWSGSVGRPERAGQRVRGGRLAGRDGARGRARGVGRPVQSRSR